MSATLATTTADVLSLKLYHLTEIVKLAAFAAEARRTLCAISQIPTANFQEHIEANVSACNNWTVQEDNTGEVLLYIASALEEVNDEFTEAVHVLVRAGQIGGTT